MADKFTWLRVSRTADVGPITFRVLQKRFSDPERALEYLESKGKCIPSVKSIQQEVDEIKNLGADIIFLDQDEYPVLLREIPDAPPFLFTLGTLSLFKKNLISIVGSRNSSLAGNQIARNLSQGLSEAGYTVVSGLARGIDRHAHLGAMENTIGVIASGIDQVYPLENIDLYNSMKQSSLILTEARIGSPPEGRMFHARNRIIAGLSKATIIIEATVNSGSLITAQYALEYNRDIMAVPGCPLDSRSEGPNTLIQNGATLVKNIQDVLKHLRCNIELKEEYKPEKIKDTDSLRYNLLSLLSSTPTPIDELQRSLDCDISTVRSLLVELEIEGKVACMTGSRVVSTS